MYDENNNMLHALHRDTCASEPARAFEALLIKCILIERVVGEQHLDIGVQALIDALIHSDEDGATLTAEAELEQITEAEREQIATIAALTVDAAIRRAIVILASATSLLGQAVADFSDVEPAVVIALAAGLHWDQRGGRQAIEAIVSRESVALSPLRQAGNLGPRSEDA